ncbi:MAG: hypothetical protein ACW99J_16130 [Candidatus Thorarchaeota archaeon]|jgi:hypothetical protein
MPTLRNAKQTARLTEFDPFGDEGGFYSPQTNEQVSGSQGGDIFDSEPSGPSSSYAAPTPSGGNYPWVNPTQFSPSPGTYKTEEAPITSTILRGKGDTGFRGGSYMPAKPLPQPEAIGSTTTQTTSFTPSGEPRPDFVAPDYVPVEFDKRRLAALRQKKAAPFRRALTRELQRAFTGSYKDKPSRDIAIRNALREYGQAYGQILVHSEAAARSELEQETAELRQERRLEFQAAMTEAQLEFQTAWDAWLKAGTTTTTATQQIQFGYPGLTERGEQRLTPRSGGGYDVKRGRSLVL